MHLRLGKTRLERLPNVAWEPMPQTSVSSFTVCRHAADVSKFIDVGGSKDVYIGKQGKPCEIYNLESDSASIKRNSLLHIFCKQVFFIFHRYLLRSCYRILTGEKHKMKQTAIVVFMCGR